MNHVTHSTHQTKVGVHVWPGLGFEVHWIFGCNNVEVFCFVF